MSRQLVVDASVAVRFVVKGVGSTNARLVLADHSRRALELNAPALQRTEVASALWKYKRAGELSRVQMDAAYDRYLRAAIHYHAEDWLDRTALALASTHDRSVYDCLYLALSLELGCELLTADRRFFNAVGPAFPQMRLLRTDDSQAAS